MTENFIIQISLHVQTTREKFITFWCSWCRISLQHVERIKPPDWFHGLSGPSNDSTLLNGWICLHGVLD